MDYIVTSLLENDLYKFTMWQAMFHQHPTATAEYEFTCRSTPDFPLARLLPAARREFEQLFDLKFADHELAYLSGLPYIAPDFIEFLKTFRFQSQFINLDRDGDKLCITASGLQIQVMNFEIFCLYIVSELYSRNFDQTNLLSEGRQRLQQKISVLKAFSKNFPHLPFAFFDFGLRRRANAAWHAEVVDTLSRELPSQFKGTSDVYLAMKLGLTPIGTMAHEYLQSYQAYIEPLADFQRQALWDWLKEYQGMLAIALTDTVSMQAFLNDFDVDLASRYQGLRHDSGDPFLWGEKAIAHYTKLGIDCREKQLIFSDSLDIGKALAINRQFSGRVKPGFGIGTHLSNDVGITPLNLVMKLVRCNGKPVAKLSDAPGKIFGTNQTFIDHLRQIFQQKDLLTRQA